MEYSCNELKLKFRHMSWSKFDMPIPKVHEKLTSFSDNRNWKVIYRKQFADEWELIMVEI